jgi:hypothetical protein
MKAYVNLKLLLVHKFFFIEQSFPTPYFHIVFLTKMIWNKDLKCPRCPKQGVSTFGDWILHKNFVTPRFPSGQAMYVRAHVTGYVLWLDQLKAIKPVIHSGIFLSDASGPSSWNRIR